MDIIIVILFSYLSGSIPFGLILTRFFGGQDVRKIGSGNIGATNVLRTGNKYLAATTLILDILKGYAPVVVTQNYFPEYIQLSALLAFLGHIFPLWLKFKGGKGVATYLGILLALSYSLGFLFMFTWVAVSLIFRYSSLSSLIATLSIPLYLFIFLNSNDLFFFLIMFILVFFTHRENIKRLINKEESKTKIY